MTRLAGRGVRLTAPAWAAERRPQWCATCSGKPPARGAGRRRVNALEGHIDVLTAAGDCTVPHPHDGGVCPAGGERRRATALGRRVFAVEHACRLVLRDTAPSPPSHGSAYINTANGNRWPGERRRAGRADPLCWPGLPALQAVPMAVWLHGEAGRSEPAPLESME